MKERGERDDSDEAVERFGHIRGVGLIWNGAGLFRWAWKFNLQNNKLKPETLDGNRY